MNLSQVIVVKCRVLISAYGKRDPRKRIATVQIRILPKRVVPKRIVPFYKSAKVTPLALTSTASNSFCIKLNSAFTLPFFLLKMNCPVCAQFPIR